MNHVSKIKRLALPVALLIIVTVATAWQFKSKKQKQDRKNTYSYNDTLKPCTIYTDKINIRINVDSVMQAVGLALKNIDLGKVQIDVNNAVAEIDLNEINETINESFKSIDWGKINAEVTVALKQARTEVENINTNELKEELRKVQIKLNSKEFKAQINTDNIQKEVHEALKNVQIELENNLDWKNYKAFLKALSIDQLIDTTKPYSIELKDGDLYLNDVKQNKETTDKYRQFYQNRKHFTIKNSPSEIEEDGENL